MKKLFTLSTLFFLLLPAIVLIPSVAKSQQVIVGTGTALSVFSPINRSNDYCVYEIIYLASDINLPGDITHLAFERADGTDTALIQNVDLYMMHTTQTQVSAGTFDTTGYTHVYSGTFPNDAGFGWREVMLDVPFTYNGTDNLEVLAVKGYQPAVANTPVTPRWYYTNISPSPARARRYYGNTAITNTTNLSTISFSSNVRLTFDISTGTVEIIPGRFHIYPNPASNELRISNAGFTIHNVAIYDILGQKHLSLNSPATGNEFSTSIDISQLPTGVYFVKVNTLDKMYIEKLIKE
ncbi:MAG: T9SS type A sorting domain-containing protein [Bacteroidia bacterium]|nr:T9SS type A sorting domain-containing protein [Bacteroidia bacterium]